ncbi:MAG: ParB/RepB/Spo0J family partition protein [Nitrospiraceae bacterium]|nr:ParB/RepB/Spo0J family partition protein [Nitrospiraceae bacterium]
MEKKALGKGLDALLPTPKQGTASDSDVQQLRIDARLPNPSHPRQVFASGELAELTASIKESGVLQPVMVRRKGDGIYELISGERRWRASKEAGLATIQAVIRNCSDQESLLLALVENLQRENLNPMETARAYARMMKEFGFTQDVVAQKVGRDRTSVANAVRLMNLHPTVQALVESGTISAGHAKVILGLDSPDNQVRVAQMVADRGLSVRDLEKVVASSASAKKRAVKVHQASAHWSDLEARLQKRLGTKVTVRPQGAGGTIIIHYFSAEELNGLTDQLLS